MNPEEWQATILRRAQVIMQVRSGLLTPTEAAAQLGVSRKTYYQWERRVTQSILEGLDHKPCGRPSKRPDEQTEALQKRLAELEERERIRQQVDRIRTVIGEATTSAEKK